MEKCLYCPEKTTNIELISNSKFELIETSICVSCFKKLCVTGDI